MPQSPQTMKIIFHGAAPSGFFHTDTFTTFHNFCTPFRFIVWNYFLKIFIRIRYIQDAGKISSLWFFPNILDKTWIRIHFILYQYHGNLSISLKRGMYYAHKTFHSDKMVVIYILSRIQQNIGFCNSFGLYGTSCQKNIPYFYITFFNSIIIVFTVCQYPQAT